jgi:hypothetical protein
VTGAVHVLIGSCNPVSQPVLEPLQQPGRPLAAVVPAAAITSLLGTARTEPPVRSRIARGAAFLATASICPRPSIAPGKLHFVLQHAG